MLALAIPLFLALSAPTLEGEKEFVEALAQVDRMIGLGNAKKAKELLLETIEESKDEPWALYHFTEVLDDLRRATFWSSNVKPDPKTLVSGELLTWSASSGQIKVRYRLGDQNSNVVGTGAKARKNELPPKLRDFEKSDAVLIHPIAFEGAYTIEIDGRNYPKLTDPPKPPGIAVCTTWDRHSIVSFGLMGGKSYVPARIIHVDGGEVTTEDESSMERIPSGDFQLKVVVSSSSITVYSEGSEILTAKKPPQIYGGIAFLNLPDVDEIRISGKAQPSWLQGIVDAAIQERWTEFEKGYKPADDLPAWFREKAWGSVKTREWTDRSVPGAANSSDEACVKGFFEKLEEKGPEKALAAIRSTSGMSTRPELNSWLAAFALRALGREEEAIAECTKVCEADPRFLPARRMKVELELDVASAGEAFESCKQVVADFPDEPKAYYDLAELDLLQGRLENARASLRASIDAGVPAGTLEEAEHLVVRAIRGPLWSRAFEYKTRNYVVRSDIDQATAAEAAMLLEKFNAKFNIHLRRIPGMEKKTFRVFLFSGEEGYGAYTRDLIGYEPENTAGLYSRVVKQLLIWNLPDKEQMMRTVRHEGFHQYFDSLVGASPTWFNEGLAEYYEGSKLVKGAWSDGEINSGHLEVLTEKGLIPLADFLPVRPGVFYHPTNVQRCYAQAWAFVHYLQNGGKEPKKRFDTLLDALIAGKKPKEAIEQAFEKESLPKLEKDFAAYVSKMR